ncbi:MAG: XRE family transcriptional regulator [Clostridiales bacterium]|nr:MAG: XRE family transcriptional regulator [Clostridiales bacterium]
MDSVQTAAIIKNLCRQKNISVSKLLLECEIRKSFIYDLEKRNKIPSGEILERIADYLDCSTDFLLGRTVNPKVNK